MTEGPHRQAQGNKQPEAAAQVVSGRVPVLAVSLAALAVIGAATANSLPGSGGFSLPDFNQFSLPGADRFSLPDFSRFSPPNFNRAAAPAPLPAPVVAPAPVLVPDPVVRAGLRDIQSSQQQHADALESLTQHSATQQADLKRISRQLSLLTAQVNSLQNPVTPALTTSSIPLPTASGFPMSPTSSMPRPNHRARVVQASRRVLPPALSPTPPATLPVLPKPAGPVSVGGAPLSPAPAPASGAS